MYPSHYGRKQRGTEGALPRSCPQHFKQTLVGTLKLECIEVGDREARQKTAIGHVKPQVTVAHLWVRICFVFQTHGGLARKYTHKKGNVRMSHSGSCVGKGTPRYVDRQKVTINVSQIKETARPGAIKEGFLVEENLVSTQDSSVLHRSPFPVQWSSLIFSLLSSSPREIPFHLYCSEEEMGLPLGHGGLEHCSHTEKL